LGFLHFLEPTFGTSPKPPYSAMPRATVFSFIGKVWVVLGSEMYAHFPFQFTIISYFNSKRYKMKHLISAKLCTSIFHVLLTNKNAGARLENLYKCPSKKL
jgi:hypothetical protein